MISPTWLIEARRAAEESRRAAKEGRFADLGVLAGALSEGSAGPSPDGEAPSLLAIAGLLARAEVGEAALSEPIATTTRPRRAVPHVGGGGMSPPDEALFRAASRVRERVFGRKVGLFAPLYYSNLCANDCVYCGFRRSLGRSGRRVLSREEIAAEARILTAQGHRRILLIASEDPTARGLELALDAVETVHSASRDWGNGSAPRPGENGSASHHGVAERVASPPSPPALSLALEIAPRSPSEFARLREAGVSTYILFQETYDPDLYARLHPSGPKADFSRRLQAPACAAQGGIPRLGLGVLHGLGDPVFETVALVAHARQLANETGRPAASVSVPRVEPAEDVPFTLAPPHPVSDRLWLHVVAALRLALPYTNVIVSTREPAELRRASLRAGATLFSAGSRTDPGGYARPGDSRGQFVVGDPRSLAEVAADLRRLGFEPDAEAERCASDRGDPSACVGSDSLRNTD